MPPELLLGPKVNFLLDMQSAHMLSDKEGNPT